MSTNQIHELLEKIEVVNDEIALTEQDHKSAALAFSTDSNDASAGEKYRTSNAHLADLRGELKLLNDALGYAQEAENLARVQAAEQEAAQHRANASALHVERMAVANKIDKTLAEFDKVMTEWREVNARIATETVEAYRLERAPADQYIGIGRNLSAACLNAIASQIDRALRDLPANLHFNFQYIGRKYPNPDLVAEEVRV